MGRGARSRLATVLFTDIAGSSRVAAALGDRRWRVLLGRHHTLVRKQLKRFGGREIDTAGDGFFATFEGQSDAIRCACAISDAVRALGIEIRSGLHVGEVEVLGRKLGGVAVHMAARVMQAAAPGEVLVSGVMKDLVPGSGFSFEDRGLHRLKGIPEEWRLYAITAIDGKPRLQSLEGGVAARLREQIQPPAAMQTRGGRLALISILVALTVTSTVIIVNIARRAPPLRLADNSIVRVDAAEGTIAENVAVGRHPTAVLTAGTSLWVANFADQTISRIDLDNGSVRTIAAQGAPTALAVGADAVWVANGFAASVSRTNPATDSIVQTIRVGSGPDAITSLRDSVWVANRIDDTVVRIDPTTNSVTDVVEVASSPVALAQGVGDLWVANHLSSSVWRIDPETTEVTAKIAVPAPPDAIAASQDAVWVTSGLANSLYRIDPEANAVTTTIRTGPGPAGIAVADDMVYVANSLAGTISEIDPDVNRVTSVVDVGGHPDAVTAGSDGIWVTGHSL